MDMNSLSDLSEGFVSLHMWRVKFACVPHTQTQFLIVYTYYLEPLYDHKTWPKEN